jgi:hypothetical protein
MEKQQYATLRTLSLAKTLPYTQLPSANILTLCVTDFAPPKNWQATPGPFLVECSGSFNFLLCTPVCCSTLHTLWAKSLTNCPFLKLTKMEKS